MLQRGQDISNRDWELLRVAIVDMRNNTYVARLFFGNQETGEVAWDCDCRPSDGLWLSKQVLSWLSIAPNLQPVDSEACNLSDTLANRVLHTALSPSSLDLLARVSVGSMHL